MPRKSAISLAVRGAISKSRLYTAYSSGLIPEGAISSLSRRRIRWPVTKKLKSSEMSARKSSTEL